MTVNGQFSLSLVLLICLYAYPIMGRAQQPALLTNGLVAYYPFNGDTHDASGHGNNGTASGVGFGLDRFGFKNRACTFLQGGGQVVVRNNATLQFSNAITVSAWCNFDQNGTDSPRIVSKGWASRAHGVFELATIGTSEFRTVAFVADQQVVLESTVPARAGQWLHYLATYDGEIFRLYINGELNAVYFGPGYLLDNSTDLVIGRNSITGNDHYSGLIDDVRLYNRAFSDSEVQALYQFESQPDPARQLSGPFIQAFGTGTPGDWTVDAGGATDALPFEAGPGISVLSQADSGSFVHGGNYNQFSGFWVAHHRFILPTNAINAQLVYGNYAADDRSVMFLNGTEIAAGSVGTPNVMVFSDNGPQVPFTFPTSLQSGFVVSGFQPGTNHLDIIVNNTGATAALRRPAPGDPTSLTLFGSISYYLTAPVPPPGLSITTAPGSGARVTMTLSPGATYQLQLSRDLVNWTNVGAKFLAQDQSTSQILNETGQAGFLRLVLSP